MKIALINPPEKLTHQLNISSTQYPLNLGYLAAVLIKAGHDVEIWDYVVEQYEESNLIDKIDTLKPDIIGITSMTNTISSVAALCKTIKRKETGISIVVGGTHSTVLPERTMMEIPEIDYIIIGEGELTIVEFCERFKEKQGMAGALGVVYRDNDSIIKNEPRPLMPDINDIPFPARHLVNADLYTRTHTSRGISRKFYKVSELMTSRGCPSQCIFCAGHTSYGHRIRFRSVENVLAEAKQCIARYGTQHFTILDDTFTLLPDRTIQICDGFKKLGVTWDCNTRVNNVSRDLIFKMKDTGCKKISFGVESSTERMLKLIKKGITLEQVRNAVKWAKEAKIGIIEGTFILGAHPAETYEDVEATIKLMKELDMDFVFYGIIIPFPGTEVCEIMTAKGYINKNSSWEKYSFAENEPPQWRTDNFSPEELVRLQKEVLRKFYFRPSYALKRLAKIRSFAEVKYYVNVGIDFIKNFFM